jgi:hypothetical protein
VGVRFGVDGRNVRTGSGVEVGVDGRKVRVRVRVGGGVEVGVGHGKHFE